MLFGSLNSNIFMLFSGENRFLYEEVLFQIYERCFGAELLFPAQTELIGLIYDVLAARPDLWHDEAEMVALEEISARGRRLRPRSGGEASDATSEGIARARHVYARLIETGWLDETRYGLRITVDMPPGAMRLAEFLTLLRHGTSEQLGGLVIEVKNAVEAVRASASQNALGLHKAARDAVGFGRYLRSVLSALREIDRQIVSSENLNERLQHYFEDFVERVLLRDYARIATTAHPYRFRYAILDALQEIEDSPVDMAHLTAAYLEANLAHEERLSRDLVFDDLDKIRRVFRTIDEAFQRIQQHRAQLEVRLRNTVRYAGRRADAFLRRSGVIVASLDRLANSAARQGREIEIDGQLELVRHPFAPALLARLRGERPMAEAQVIELVPPDPVHLLRRDLEREYLARITIDPAKVVRFLDRQLAGLATLEASDISLRDVDEFLAFETLRRAIRAVANETADDRLTKLLHGRYQFEVLQDRQIDNDWLTCQDFRIRRLDRFQAQGEHHAG